MARSGDTTIDFNERFFEDTLRSRAVEKLVDAAAERSLAAAKAGAPVDTGEYREGLHLEHHDSRYRKSARVVGSDPKTLIIESTTGNLARSLRAARGS